MLYLFSDDNRSVSFKGHHHLPPGYGLGRFPVVHLQARWLEDQKDQAWIRDALGPRGMSSLVVLGAGDRGPAVMRLKPSKETGGPTMTTIPSGITGALKAQCHLPGESRWHGHAFKNLPRRGWSRTPSWGRSFAIQVILQRAAPLLAKARRYFYPNHADTSQHLLTARQRGSLHVVQS